MSLVLCGEEKKKNKWGGDLSEAGRFSGAKDICDINKVEFFFFFFRRGEPLEMFLSCGMILVDSGKAISCACITSSDIQTNHPHHWSSSGPHPFSPSSISQLIMCLQFLFPKSRLHLATYWFCKIYIGSYTVDFLSHWHSLCLYINLQPVGSDSSVVTNRIYWRKLLLWAKS